jgi:hypothetical protein
MGIELYWDNDEQTVMLCEFDKHWTWEEMFQTLDTIKKVTDKRDYEIGAIIDVSRGINIPGGSLFSAETRDKARQMLKMGEDGKGPMVIVGAGSFFKTLMSAFGMITSDKTVLNDVYFTDSLDEARRIMARRLQAGTAVPA